MADALRELETFQQASRKAASEAPEPSRKKARADGGGAKAALEAAERSAAQLLAQVSRAGSLVGTVREYVGRAPAALAPRMARRPSPPYPPYAA